MELGMIGLGPTWLTSPASAARGNVIVSWRLDLAARALIESPEMLFTRRHESGGHQERAAVAEGAG